MMLSRAMSTSKAPARTYATWDASKKAPSVTILTPTTATGASGSPLRANIGKTYNAVTGGKWYWELNGFTVYIGFCSSLFPFTNYAPPGTDVGGQSVGYASSGAVLYSNAVAYTYPSFASGDVIGVGMDMTTGNISFYKNGVLVGTPSTGLTSGMWYPCVGVNSNGTIANFGQSPLLYTPSGYNAGLW